MSVAVEIAIEDLAGLEVAALAGADRVELCVDLARGGLTRPPSWSRTVQRARPPWSPPGMPSPTSTCTH